MTRSDHSRRGSHSRTGHEDGVYWDQTERRQQQHLYARCQAYDVAEQHWSVEDEEYDEDYYANQRARRAARRCARRDRRLLKPIELHDVEVRANPDDDGSPKVEDDLLSDAGSEWSVVTEAETVWSVETWEGVQPWPEETFSDAAIARALHDDERVAAFLTYLPERRLGRPACPRLATVVEEALEERLGACAVCSEHVASVVMEPCGHLALCGGCHEAWAASSSTCALCRTPGHGVHLLCPPPARGSDAWSWHVPSSFGVCVRLHDGRVSVPALEPRRRSAEGAGGGRTKLQFRQEMRALTKRARARHRTSGATVSGAARAGGEPARRAREAAEADSWATYAANMRRWRSAKQYAAQQKSLPARERAASMVAMPRWQRSRYAFPAPPDPVYTMTHYEPGGFWRSRYRHQHWWWTSREAQHEVRQQRQSVTAGKNTLRRETAGAVRERAEARRMEIERAAAAREAADEAARMAADVAAAPTECADCGAAEACMMALPCRCFGLCRPCWAARSREGEVCVRCGAACELSLCVHKA